MEKAVYSDNQKMIAHLLHHSTLSIKTLSKWFNRDIIQLVLNYQGGLGSDSTFDHQRVFALSWDELITLVKSEIHPSYTSVYFDLIMETIEYEHVNQFDLFYDNEVLRFFIKASNFSVPRLLWIFRPSIKIEYIIRNDIVKPTVEQYLSLDKNSVTQFLSLLGETCAKEFWHNLSVQDNIHGGDISLKSRVPTPGIIQVDW